MVYRSSTGTSGGMTVVATPPSSNTAGSGSITGGGVTAMVIGGTAPYTYQWNLAYGQSLGVNTATAMSTTFTTFLNDGDSTTSGYYCTVTDAAAKVVDSNIAVVNFQFF